MYWFLTSFLMPNVSHPHFHFAATLLDKRFAYMKHPISKTVHLYQAPRLHETHILKITCRFVYVKRPHFFENALWPTPNATFWEQLMTSSLGVGGRSDATLPSKLASRLRKTATFKKCHSQPCVSSTWNTHLKNQVSSRLREMICFFEKWALAYVKH